MPKDTKKSPSPRNMAEEGSISDFVGKITEHVKQNF
jgi:hypothetical protein